MHKIEARGLALPGGIILPAGPAGGLIVFGAAAAGAILGAWFMEYVVGVPPCTLCFTQRYAWWAAGGVGLLAALGARVRPDHRRTILTAGFGLAALCVAVGAGYAGYHAGIEQGWWPGPASCTGGADGAMPGSIAEMQAMLESTNLVTACDEIAWSILGLSLAALNLFLALGTLGVAALVWRAGSGGAARTSQTREASQ